MLSKKKEKVIEQIQEDDDAVNKIFKREKEKIQKYFELEPWELSSYFGRFLYENLDKVKKDSFENIVEEFKIYYQKKPLIFNIPSLKTEGIFFYKNNKIHDIITSEV